MFDMDDTLYPMRHFVVSGFRAAAAHAASAWQVPEGDALRLLGRAFVTHRGRELQRLQEHYALPDGAVPALVDVIRLHTPAIRLPRLARHMLQAMRAGWRLAVVTNGRPDIQARKAAALELGAFVDAVVFATATGRGEGKPAAAPFLDACGRLGVAPGRAVFVGDDPRCDVGGARSVGMKTIWLTRQPAAGGTAASDADATLASLAGVPAAAERLLPHARSPHAA
jgi:putative hydrolase of the HAD superfamily